MSLLWILLAADGGSSPLVEQPEVVVTGSRVATSPGDLGANVTVLSREDFAAGKPRQLTDILGRVGGVHLDQVGGRGGTGSLYLRGADPNYTLVLVDGIRVNDPTNARGGSYDFSSLDVADVERVEVARGPYSAVYGGDALAGVVNIVTRRGPQQQTRAALDAMGGAYGVHEFALDAGGPAGDINWQLGASDSHEGEVVRGNRFDAQRFSGALDTQFGATRLFVNGRYTDSSRAGFPDDSGGDEFATLRATEEREAQEATFGTGIDTRVGDATFTLTAGYFDRDERIDSPGVAPGIRDPFGVPPSVTDTALTRYSATFTGTQKFSRHLTLAYGADWLREEGSSDGLLDFGGGFVLPTAFDLTRNSWAPFAEARVTSDFGLALQAGVRVDQPDNAGSVTSPRARLEYSIGRGLSIAGAWGKAFKLPSMYALGHPLIGNPALESERSESRELQLAQDLLGGRAHWSVTWFDSEYRNAIDFEAGPPPMLVNRDRADSQGFEFSGLMKAGDDWQFDASVTQVRTRIAATGDELRNRPEWRGGAGARWTPAEAFTLSASATYVGSTLDSSIPTGDVRLPSWLRLDLAASWQVSENFETWLAIENLTDEQYQQFVGFEARGILPRLGVKFSL